jgi:hypothetical protein
VLLPQELQVPAELLMACSLTEAVDPHPETCERKEPGYVSDAKTPHRISIGFCQLLISTARAAINDPQIGRDWLLDPANSLRACAAYMKTQAKSTGFDPVYAACAYNAGGLYANPNRWGLRQFPLGTSKHADRFVAYFHACLELNWPRGT